MSIPRLHTLAGLFLGSLSAIHPLVHIPPLLIFQRYLGGASGTLLSGVNNIFYAELSTLISVDQVDINLLAIASCSVKCIELLSELSSLLILASLSSQEKNLLSCAQ